MPLIALSDMSPEPLSMIFIQFVMYSVVQRSVDCTLAVTEVLNLLLNLIDSALSISLVKLTFCVSCESCESCGSCVSCVSCVAGRYEKSENSSNVSKLPEFHRFEDKPSKSAIINCILIPSDASDAVRS